MRWVQIGLAAGLGLLLSPGAARAGTVSFSKEIVPILRDNCSKCHNAKQKTGGFSVSTFADIEHGSKSGKLLAPKAEDSRIVKLLEGTAQPKMPPTGPLAKPQIEKIKAWINAGAKPDVAPDAVLIQESAIPAAKVPVIKLKTPMNPEITALAWSNDGKVLAVGSYKVVHLYNPETGELIRDLKDHADKVHDVEFSRDGKLLAAAGGLPAQQGEIKIWEVATGNLVKTINGHTDFIYSCSWGAEDKTIASASYDKTIKIWTVATGAEEKTLKDHADAVYAVAYNPAGNLLASGSADRSVKVWDVSTGKRIYTLAGHGDTVYSLAWNKAGSQISSCGADKSLRGWNVNAQNGQAARNNLASDLAINRVVYSMDGSLMATAANDKTVKVWDGNGGLKQTIKDLTDAMYAVALSPDNKMVAAGGADGTLKLFTVADGKPAKTLIDLPKVVAAAPPPDPKTAKPAAPAKGATPAKVVTPAKPDVKKPEAAGKK